MLSVFRRLFEGGGAAGREKSGPGDRVKTATCVILLEAATADETLSGEERKKIVDVLKERFSMTDREAEELIASSVAERKDATDLWHFTSIINRSLGNEEKYEIMELVWEVIYSDGTLDKFENYVARKLLNTLNIDHSKFIELKLAAKSRAGVE
ncbi:MAG: TerB family tellurite resistance protein [Candidatus Dadabacteria bacterium]|nr:TerB family tellurite resistance protein [Candidatus Dadabacteria bacterium]